jgi:hypothetical protein
LHCLIELRVAGGEKGWLKCAAIGRVMGVKWLIATRAGLTADQ